MARSSRRRGRPHDDLIGSYVFVSCGEGTSVRCRVIDTHIWDGKKECRVCINGATLRWIKTDDWSLTPPSGGGGDDDDKNAYDNDDASSVVEDDIFLEPPFPVASFTGSSSSSSSSSSASGASEALTPRWKRCRRFLPEHQAMQAVTPVERPQCEQPPTPVVRPRRERPTPRAALGLCEFPPGSFVFTPRWGVAGGGSWCRVIRHDLGQLRVAVPDEPTALVSLETLNARRELGLPFQRPARHERGAAQRALFP